MKPENKYTVHSRLTNAESRLLALEQENKQLRQWVDGALTNKINDARNLIQDSIHQGVDGKDGQSIVGPQGPQGERGDVQYLTPEELNTEIKALRRKLLELRAAFLARTTQHIADFNKPEHQSSTYRMLQIHLKRIRDDIEQLR